MKNGEKMMNTRFGEFGGQYIPEILMSEINHVAEAYEKYKNESGLYEPVQGKAGINLNKDNKGE